MAGQRSKSALILAGGGIMGAAYEIGCLTAFDRLFCPGFSSRRFDLYVGISAGSVIASLIANRIQPAGLFKTITRNERTVFNWRRHDIYRFDWLATLNSSIRLPVDLFKIIRNYRRNRWTFSLQDLPHLIQEQFPSGLFSLDPMQDYLCKSFLQEGIIDSFDRLQCELYIPAYDLDLGKRVVFGTPENRDLHLCQAITASCAIPFFFQPYQVNGRSLIDGSAGRVSHIDIAIEQGAKLIILVNPRVPFHNDPDLACLPSLSHGRCSKVNELGILLTWEQSQRIEAQMKLRMGLEYYRQKHPDVDIVLIEPGSDEALLFLQGPMSIRARTQVMHHGFHLTQATLKQDYTRFAKIFAKHGITTTTERLAAPPPAEIKTTQ
jgi:predicted acylesterase/phospholipase RssA